MERVVITGLGVVSPLGCDIGSFWGKLLKKCSGIAYLQDEIFEGLSTRIGGIISDYQPEKHFSKRELRRTSRTTQFGLIAAAQAIQQAQLNQAKVDLSNIAVIIGSSIGGFSASEPHFRDYYTKGTQSALVIPLSMNYGPSANVSIRYGFQGPLMTVDAACASAAHSIGYAYNLIRMGSIDIALTGGADSPFSRGVIAAWCNLKALSERNQTPKTACRPFSGDRDGMVLGEGAGVMVIESEKSALKRNVPILAEIIGYGASSDSYHITQPISKGPVQAMQRALQDARLIPGQIDYINAHATGTVQNDTMETNAIKELFKDHAYKIPVVGIKASVGHSIGASGAIELISCVLSLKNQIVPSTINYTTFDETCDLDYVIGGSRPLKLNYILSNSFAFGGSNAVIIIGKYSRENQDN